MSKHASDLVEGLERFAADLAAGRIRRSRLPTTVWIRDEPCPACGGAVHQASRTGPYCMGRGCKYSWRPEGGDR